MARTTRRGRTTALAFALAATTPTACGQSGEASADQPAGTGSGSESAQETGSAAEDAGLLPAAEGTTEYPLTLETPWGETVLEERPERLSIATGSHAVELLAVLGVTPAGVDSMAEYLPWAMKELPAQPEEVWEIPEGSDVALEAVAASHPDLILAQDPLGLSGVYPQLSQVAPVLGPRDPETEALWQDRLVGLGEVLDLSERADQVLAEHEEFLAGVREEHPELEGRTFSYVVFWGNEWGAALINTEGSDVSTFFGEIGLQEPEQAADFGPDGTVSDELVSMLDADVMLMLNAGDPQEFAEFYENELFSQLDVSQRDDIILVQLGEDGGGDYEDGLYRDGERIDFEGHFGWAVGGWSGPLAQRAVIDALVPLISEEVSD